jgi:hypothetical protein
MNLKKFWNKWGFLILGILIAIIILFLKLSNKNEYEDRINVVTNLSTKKIKSKNSKGEIECKRVMEKIFDLPFIKIRPKWLMNDETGKNLEIDCYNPDLKIGVEYQGSQHDHFSPYFHKTYDNFIKQQQRDALKRKKCFSYGITLIEVPYTLEIKDIEKFLVQELKKNGKI